MNAAGLTGGVSGVELIAAERQRQIEVEGWTPEHDDCHTSGELAEAAYCYATCDGTTDYSAFSTQACAQRYPWGASSFKPRDRMSNLVRAGALYLAEKERVGRLADDIAAEIDRLQRIKS